MSTHQSNNIECTSGGVKHIPFEHTGSAGVCIAPIPTIIGYSLHIFVDIMSICIISKNLYGRRSNSHGCVRGDVERRSIHNTCIGFTTKTSTVIGYCRLIFVDIVVIRIKIYNTLLVREGVVYSSL